MTFYLSSWSKNIELNTGNSLEKENVLVEERLNPEGKNVADQNAIKTLKKEIEDIISIERMPLEIQEEFVRAKLSIAPHFWHDYTCELKGKTIAIEIIKSQLERIHKFYNHMDSVNKSKKGR